MTAHSEITIDRSIPFVDTHHHLWELDQLEYSWLAGPDISDDTHLGDYAAIRVDWGPRRLFREFSGQNVIKSIHVEAAMSGPDPVAETAWLDGVNREYGMPNALVAACDLRSTSVGDELDRHLAASSLVRGIRTEVPADSSDAAFSAGLTALRDRGLSFDLNLPPRHLADGVELVRRHPDVAFVVGHAGAPPVSDPTAFSDWAAAISALAESDNVTCKISGMGMYDHEWTVESIRPWVLHCVEAFGPERAMFGTNWPVDVIYAPYFETVDAYRLILAEAGVEDDVQHALLHANAERIYRI